jgi:hypothetical protein
VQSHGKKDEMLNDDIIKHTKDGGRPKRKWEDEDGYKKSQSKRVARSQRAGVPLDAQKRSN